MPLVLNGTTGVQDNSGAFVLGTAVASTSGTSIDFTGIPSWVKRITVMCNSVSTNSTSVVQIQLGAGSVSTSGYYATAFSWTGGNQGTNLSTGFPIKAASGATAGDIVSGQIIFSTMGSNLWVGSGTFTLATANGGASFSAGNITLGGTLDRVRITTVNGTDTFDAGSINILYE